MTHKILQIVTSINLGGAENVAFNLAEHCFKGNPAWEITIAEVVPGVGHYSIEKSRELAQSGVKVCRLGSFGKWISLAVAPYRLYRLIRDEQPALVHSHTDIPDFILSICLRICIWKRVPIPRIVRTIHNVSLWGTRERAGRFTEKMFKDDVIVAVSKSAFEAYELLRSRFGLQSSMSKTIIYNGIHAAASSISYFNIKPNVYNIGFCGRFDQQKGLDVLCSWIESLNEAHLSRVCFHFVGKGPLLSRLQALAANHPNHIILYPAKPGIATHFHELDLGVMPSRFEGLPLVGIEFCLARVPVAISKCEALREVFPADWPVNIDISNSSSLKNLIESLPILGADLQKLGEECYANAKNKFDLGTMVSSYESLYESVVQESIANSVPPTARSSVSLLRTS